MPRATRAATKSTVQRSVPYSRRSVSNTSQINNMVAAVSTPIVSMGWEPVSQPHYYLNPQQQEQYDHHTYHVMQTQYTTIPTPVSGALPVQSVRTPSISIPVTHPQHPQHPQHQHHNSGASGPWTAEMDEILIENHRRLKWDQIAEQFFNNQKTGNACRKRYARVVHERKDPSRWEPEKVQHVIDVYNREGTREKIWRALAEAVGESWQNVERLCLAQGYKQMTGKTSYGHRKRPSQAPSHRSQASVNSDHGQHGAFDEDDPTDDSGIGADVHSGHQYVQPTGPIYAEREQYHDDIPAYAPETYYRGYRE